MYRITNGHSSLQVFLDNDEVHILVYDAEGASTIEMNYDQTLELYLALERLLDKLPVTQRQTVRKGEP